ncbi:MAG: potassium transporter Kup [Chloroflexaceae bacterium]|jgi:KUP system potassium uptake protein|nr:potassium transporter Kup [Chloroflexaceae bacterium]
MSSQAGQPLEQQPPGTHSSESAHANESQRAHSHPHRGRLAVLALAALGVVYGDIGTSPLYALRECFHGIHAIAPTPANIYGVLSLIFWALIIVVTIKYIVFILRANNRGEGGIMALTALATPIRRLEPSQRRWIVILGVFGAALLYGDGIITPAISVLSAVEGLRIATPLFTPYVVPLTVVILVGLFLIQKRGTGQIGRFFGPIMLLWFGVLALLGSIHIVENPAVLTAINPLYAASFFAANGWTGFLILGTVFLVVTGGEALYADMGHFGRRPIQTAWFSLVLPALLLNYFGQGAMLLAEPEAAENSFYLMAPEWALIPLVILATMATIIASQALISGAFSITMQAENLGFLPRLRIIHTSPTEFGQIYIPFVNWLLMIACIGVVLGFQSSSNLAAAYGIAVTSTMAITTMIFAVVVHEKWGWGLPRVALLVGALLVVDLAFLGANLIKIPQGGWFPIIAAVIIFTFMATWKRGSRLVNKREQNMELELDKLFSSMRQKPPVRAPGTAIFLSANPEGTPAALLLNKQYNGVVHERVLLVHVHTEEVPHVANNKRLSMHDLGQGFYAVNLRYGFMEEINVPKALAQLNSRNFKLDPQQSPYFISRTKAIPSKFPGMALWREVLYTFMQRNAISAADFFRLPPARVVEIATSVEF